jgi:hypothetical protein
MRQPRRPLGRDDGKPGDFTWPNIRHQKLRRRDATNRKIKPANLYAWNGTRQRD